MLLEVSNICENSEKVLKPCVTDMFMFPHSKMGKLMVLVYRNERVLNGLIGSFPSPNTNIALEGSANIIAVPTATFSPVIIIHKTT